MPISPWDNAFNREPLRKETREFDLPNGQKLSLTLEKMDPLQEAAAFDKYSEYIELYLTNKEPLMSPFGEQLVASKPILAEIATLQMMQRTADESEQPYNLLDWMGFAKRLPEFWKELTEWSDSFSPPKKKDDGKGNSVTKASAPETTAPTGTPSTP